MSLPSLLHYEDRNSMAFSVESRTPFLDYRIVELAFKVPSQFHIYNGQRKNLLRKAMRGIIPEAIRKRKDKLGFVAPGVEWPNLFDKPGDFDPKVFNPQAARKALAEGDMSWKLGTVLLSHTALA
jgi:asparagine synthase (glutamine-hydrolysing)